MTADRSRPPCERNDTMTPIIGVSSLAWATARILLGRQRGRPPPSRTNGPGIVDALVRDRDVVDVAREVVAGRVDLVAVQLACDRDRAVVRDVAGAALGSCDDLAVDVEREAGRGARAADDVPLAVAQHAGDDLLAQELARRVRAAEDAGQLAVRVLELEVPARRAGLALLDDVAEVLGRAIANLDAVVARARVRRGAL